MDVALVHVAYHGAWCWDRLRPELESKLRFLRGMSHLLVIPPTERSRTADDTAV